MKELTITENSHFIFGQCNIRLARKILIIFSIPVALLPQRLSQDFFNRCILLLILCMFSQRYFGVNTSAIVINLFHIFQKSFKPLFINNIIILIINPYPIRILWHRKCLNNTISPLFQIIFSFRQHKDIICLCFISI